MKKDVHIRIDNKIDKFIREYCRNKNVNYSKGVNMLLENAMNDRNNKLLNEILTEVKYNDYSISVVKRLLEQIFADINITNTKEIEKCQGLKNFYFKYYGLPFSDGGGYYR